MYGFKKSVSPWCFWGLLVWLALFFDVVASFFDVRFWGWAGVIMSLIGVNLSLRVSAGVSDLLDYCPGPLGGRYWGRPGDNVRGALAFCIRVLAFCIITNWDPKSPAIKKALHIAPYRGLRGPGGIPGLLFNLGLVVAFYIALRWVSWGSFSSGRSRGWSR